jgi:hypothetical protein
MQYIYLYAVYLIMQSGTKNIQHQMIGCWYITNTINWKGSGRKYSLHNSRYYASSLEGLRKTMKNVSLDSQCPNHDLSQAPPEYKSAIPLEPIFSVITPHRFSSPSAFTVSLTNLV